MRVEIDYLLLYDLLACGTTKEKEESKISQENDYNLSLTRLASPKRYPAEKNS